MKIDLYPCFQHLKEFNTIWFYSDPHFYDEEIFFLRNDYVSDQEQINRINSKVGKKDVLFILGDVGDVTFIKRLRGYKILVMGNHDRGKSNYTRKVVDGIDNHLFDEVYEGVVMLNNKILLSHEPVNLPFVFNIHGHDHSNIEAYDSDLHLNVCAEHINYTPVSLNELVKNGYFKDVPDIHRMTIDKAINKKQKHNNE